MTFLDGLLERCPWAVDADLLRMGVDLEAARRGQGLGKLRIARLVYHLPQGADIWRELGGYEAWSAEELRLVEARHQELVIAHAKSGQSGQAPKFPPPPIGLLKERENAKIKIRRASTVGKAQAKRLADPEYRAEMQRRIDSWGDNWMTSEAQKKRAEASARMATWEQ